MQPRPYQQSAFTDTRQAFKQGHKHICICMCGGAGKSLLCKMILESAVKKGGKLGFFSFRKSLTEQIKKYNIPNCTIGTLQKHGKVETEEYDLVIFDEKDYHNTKLKNNIKSKYSITLSGFPTDSDGYVLDYDFIVEAIQYPELVELGFAKKLKLLSMSKISTDGLKKQGGDFHKGQSFDLMEKSSIKKDIVDTYKKYCIGRKTLLFAIDTKHAESLKEEFISNGIKCETIHSKKDDSNIIEDFESGKFDLLINVAMISIGVDIPCINTIIFARPMCSVPLFMQCVWRGTRKFNDDYCLVLDMAEVLKRTEFHPMQKLDLKRVKSRRKIKSCKSCQNDLIIINKKIKPNDNITYTEITTYKCSVCSEVEIVEEMKVINMNFCDKCGIQLEEKNIEYKQTDKAIEFVFTCGCGNIKVERSILLTDKELKIIEYEEIMKAPVSWEKIAIMLREDCKKWGYNHRYSLRLIDIMQGKGKTPEETELYILNIRESGAKISSLQFKG